MSLQQIKKMAFGGNYACLVKTSMMSDEGGSEILFRR